MTARDVPFDEEVAERDSETQECFADIRPMSELEEARRRFQMAFDEASKSMVITFREVKPR